MLVESPYHGLIVPVQGCYIQPGKGLTGRVVVLLAS